MEVDALPHVDEHATVVAAGADDVWRVLTQTLARAYSRPGWVRYARLVGCADRTGSGPRPLAEGSVFAGFRVVAAVPGRELVLQGSHRFSTYALVFRLDELAPGRSRLRAETRGVFPGPAGGLYRLLVIGTGGHAVGVRHLLAGIRRRAE
nr:hypothetical protein OG999_16995 [Streptomyces sp. NBC_00886]